MKLLGDHLCIMFHLRMQRKYGDRTFCRFFIRVTGANSPVFEAPKTGLVVDVARLPFRHFFDSSRTNVIESQHHNFERARKDGTAFHYVFIEIEQKKSGKIACF